MYFTNTSSKYTDSKVDPLSKKLDETLIKIKGLGSKMDSGLKGLESKIELGFSGMREEMKDMREEIAFCRVDDHSRHGLEIQFRPFVVLY